jgi:deoxycytidylate deaminase
MNIAYAVALASKDPSSKVGCVIVGPKNMITSTGYNGMVSGCEEAELWEPREMKLEAVIHAELNALLFARRDVTGHTMYTTHAPCVNCLKHTLQAGIRDIVYHDHSIMKRTSFASNSAVMKLIEATKANVKKIDGIAYELEIYDHINNLETDKW